MPETLDMSSYLSPISANGTNLAVFMYFTGTSVRKWSSVSTFSGQVNFCRHHAKHHNVGQTAPSEAQKVTLESYKGVSRVQLGYRLVFVRKIAPFGVSPRFKSKVQIDVIKGHWSEIASKFV
jgi:hypothetical protein